MNSEEIMYRNDTQWPVFITLNAQGDQVFLGPNDDDDDDDEDEVG